MNVLERLYYLGLRVKRRYALSTRKRLPCRVISIGNLTVGGTGKTPATIAIAEEAKTRGFQPVILTRGYKGSAKGPCFVSRGDGPLLTAHEAGDEPRLMAERLRGVPIVKCADRYAGGIYALQGLGMQRDVCPLLFILDDGFQHWRLARDRDIVLIDADSPFGNRRLLPSGRLREDPAALGRADVIAITRAEREDPGLLAEIRMHNRTAPVFFTTHRMTGLVTVAGESRASGWLAGQRVYCFCALADPRSFGKMVAASGAVVTGTRSYPDHHPYSRQDIDDVAAERISSGADWVVTTAKDAVKIRDLDLPGNFLIIEITFSADRPFFDSVFS